MQLSGGFDPMITWFSGVEVGYDTGLCLFRCAGLREPCHRPIGTCLALRICLRHIDQPEAQHRAQLNREMSSHFVVEVCAIMLSTQIFQHLFHELGIPGRLEAKPMCKWNESNIGRHHFLQTCRHPLATAASQQGLACSEELSARHRWIR